MSGLLAGTPLTVTSTGPAANGAAATSTGPVNQPLASRGPLAVIVGGAAGSDSKLAPLLLETAT